VRTRPKLSLKNVFEHNFSAFAKVNFSSPKQVSNMFFTIMIPTESKYEGAKINHSGFLASNQARQFSRRLNVCMVWSIGTSEAPPCSLQGATNNTSIGCCMSK
jgi:hypothetical protein